jgi:hypothetical protein
MKVLQFLFRAGFSLFLAFIACFSSAVIFWGYSNYKLNSDRAFLVVVPTLALAFLLFQAFPTAWAWIQKRQMGMVSVFGLLSAIAAFEMVYPVAISRVYYMGMLALAFVLLGVMLPAAPALERFRVEHSLWHYSISFILVLVVSYGVVGFLGGVIKDTPNLILFSFVLVLVYTVAGYYLVRRAAVSLREGFLSTLLNVLLVLLLPALLALIIYVSTLAPAMFGYGYIRVSASWFGYFLASAFLAFAYGAAALEQFEARGWYQLLSQTQLYAFVKENLPGVYAGGVYFLINVVLARAFNHPTFSINSIVFEADAGPWMSILGLPEGHDVNRAVHPLVLITLRPLVRLVGLFVADKWFLAPIIVVGMISGLCVLMGWLFVKRAVQKDTYAFLFAILLGSTGAHLLFGSLTETYVFGMGSLIFFFLLIQADERRFSVLVPAGLLVFGITVTNIAQGMIGLFFKKFPFWKLFYYGVLVLTLGITLTSLVSVLYPGNQTMFFVPADMAFEGRFSKPVYDAPEDRLQARFAYVGRTIFLYGTVAPTPIADMARVNSDPIIDLKTYDYKDKTVSWYEGLAYIPFVLWLVLLAASLVFFFKDLKSPHMPLMLGILGSLAFNYLLHMNYGTELFLYTPYFTFLMVFFVALALSDLAGKRWFEVLLAIFVVTVMLNNVHFLYVVMQGLNPYFAAS